MVQFLECVFLQGSGYCELFGAFLLVCKFCRLSELLHLALNDIAFLVGRPTAEAGR